MASKLRIAFDELVDLIFPPDPLVEVWDEKIVQGLLQRGLLHCDSDTGITVFTGFDEKRTTSVVEAPPHAEAVSALWEGIISSALDLGIELSSAGACAFKNFNVDAGLESDYMRFDFMEPDACLLLPVQSSLEPPLLSVAEDDASRDSAPILIPRANDQDFWCRLLMPIGIH